MVQVLHSIGRLLERPSCKGLFLTASLIATVFLSVSAAAAEIEGKVLRVSDGDTITVVSGGNKYRIRFLGIDAPESNQKGGAQSRNHLASEIQKAGNYVTVQYKEKDRYGRIVGKVLANGKDLNYDQVKTGNAWFYTQYEKKLGVKERVTYRIAQKQAQSNRIGLWAEKKSHSALGV